MLNSCLLKIAVTGGVASGKSSVCQFFKNLKAYVVSADAIVHELLTPNTELGKQASQLLGIPIGPEFRKNIAEIVFKDSEKLHKLENLLHPVVLERIEKLYESISKKDYSFFVVEIPLLFEIKQEKFYDVVITVLAEEEIARMRFGKDFDARMRRQIRPEHKAALSNYVIHNNGSLEDLEKQVIQINKTLRKYEPRSRD